MGAESNSPNKARVSREGKNCCLLGPVSSKVHVVLSLVLGLAWSRSSHVLLLLISWFQDA